MAEYDGLKSRYSGWMFRGQPQTLWQLEPSLERAVSRRFGRPMATVADYESRLLRSFQRH